LPHDEVYIETTDYRVIGDAIRVLKIRGAPAIGVAAAYSVVLAVHDPKITSLQDLNTEFYAAINFLSQTRPTAVSLFVALDRMRHLYEQVSHNSILGSQFHLLAEARLIQHEDIESCRKIGEYGAALISPKSTILTHCNTGGLATSGIGTAQGIITTAAQEGKIQRVYADETRPLFQGARLTTLELMKENIDVVLITDGTAGMLMQRREIDAVVVGADRVAANGDVANKIGTYQLAVLAERHMIPFYVAAPTATIDFGTKTGKDIPIEERDPAEITHVAGIRIAAEGVSVFAPAFDITPNQLVTGIVTEVGVLKPPYNESIGKLRPQQLRTAEAAS
ncbi:MAG: S-methyl-5-thioribose-1-phosphate isomerase, partial [Ignavibacteriae bacterium]|nr:S-methyl-5-thioribose-1-phosphate isomerase [Ignavibacteriota bacterium]